MARILLSTAELTATPARCCLQDSSPGPLRRLEVLGSQEPVRKLSCCLQDRLLRHSKAKPLPRNALSPKLRCCLQDREQALLPVPRLPGSSDFAADGIRVLFRDTAASSQSFGCAISASCHGTPGGTPRLPSVFAAGIQSAAASGNPHHAKRPAEAGTSRVEKSSHNSGNAVLPYGALSHQKKTKDLGN